MKKGAAPISLAGSQLGNTRHVCALFNSEEEEYRVLLPFIKDGFTCGDKAVHVVNPNQRDDHLQRLAAELGVSDRVHALGHVSYDDLPRWYAACDLFVMPNRDIDGDTEGFGLVFLEAASAGKPAIAGIAGGTGSAVVDGASGLRVDGEQLEAIAGALTRLLANPAEAERMGMNGRNRVLENFTHQRRVDQLRELALRGRYPGAGRPKVRESQSPMA